MLGVQLGLRWVVVHSCQCCDREELISKLGGVGSLRGSVAIRIVRIENKDLCLLADR